jgi:hypothetical protein
MLGDLCEVARGKKTQSKSSVWPAIPKKRGQEQERVGEEEANGDRRNVLLHSRRCRTVGGGRGKSGHVTTGREKGGKDLCQGPPWT